MNTRHDAAMAENARRIEVCVYLLGLEVGVRRATEVMREARASRELLALHRAMREILARHAPFADGAHRTGYGCPWCLDGCGESTAWPCDDAEAALGCYETEAGE